MVFVQLCGILLVLVWRCWAWQLSCSLHAAHNKREIMDLGASSQHSRERSRGFATEIIGAVQPPNSTLGRKNLEKGRSL